MAHREGYDLILDADEVPVGLMMIKDGRRPARVGGEIGQQTEDASPRTLEVPRVWDDWSGGAGYSRYLVPGTYEEAEWGDASNPLIFLPSGAVQHVMLPSAPVGVGQQGKAQEQPRFFFELPTSPGSTTLDLYLGTGRWVYKMALGHGSPTIDQDFALNRWCDSAAVFKNTAYVSTLNGRLHKKTAGGSWTESADVQRLKLAIVNWTIRTSGAVSNAWRLVGTDSLTSFRHIDVDADPMVEANWSGRTQVGDQTYPIRSMAASAHHVYFVKTNGPYDVDERGYSPLLASWNESINELNGDASIVHPAGWLYASHHQGLTRTWIGDPMARQPGPGWCGFAADLPYEGSIRGQVTAFALNAGKLLVAFWNADSDTSYICEAQDRQEVGLDGRGPLVWHGHKATFPGKVTAMYVNALGGKPRIHYGWQDRDGVSRYSYQWLPTQTTAYADWLEGLTDFQFAPTCTLYLPRDPWGAPTGRKRIWGWEIESENLVSGNAWTVSAVADRGAYTFQGAAVESPYSELTTTTTPIEGRAIGVKLEGRGGLTRDGTPDLASPPVLRALRATAEVDVRLGTYLEYTCVLGEGVTLANGATDQRDPEVVTDQLRGLLDRGVIAAVDRGQWLSVWMLPGFRYEDRQTAAGQWQRQVTFRVRVLGRLVRYGTGEHYGSGIVYAGTTGG